MIFYCIILIFQIGCKVLTFKSSKKEKKIEVVSKKVNTGKTVILSNDQKIEKYLSKFGPIAIEEMKKEKPKGDPPIDIQTSSKGLIVNIKGDYAFPIGKASMKEELKGLLDEEIIPKIQSSPFQVEVAGHSDSDRMPKKWRKTFATNWELSAARGASVVRYMIDKGVPAPRLLAAGYGPWAPHGLDSVKKQNPMWNPLTLTWKDPVKTKDGKEMPTVLGLNKNEKMKSKNRRIQITFLNPPHHGKGRSGTSYED